MVNGEWWMVNGWLGLTCEGKPRRGDMLVAPGLTRRNENEESI